MSEKAKQNKTARLSADVTEATAELVKALAKREERTPADMVRRLIRLGLDTLTEGKAKR